jgi:hypothetical protein
MLVAILDKFSVKNPSAIAKLVSGVIKVLLDHENL